MGMYYKIIIKISIFNINALNIWNDLCKITLRQHTKNWLFCKWTHYLFLLNLCNLWIALKCDFFFLYINKFELFLKYLPIQKKIFCHCFFNLIYKNENNK